jgi:outer membrane protein assembly complex protein YaeT
MVILALILLVQGAMLVRWLTVVFLCSFLVVAEPVYSQVADSPALPSPGTPDATEAPLIEELHFDGLRRIAPAAVVAQISSHPGDSFDVAKIGADLRALTRFGWFESIRVEEAPSPVPHPEAPERQKHVILIFHLEERPFLSKVEYSGSRLLSQKQIEQLLVERKLAPGLGKPANPFTLQRIAAAIRASLNELGHPEARVQIQREEAPNATLSVRFVMNDGPHLPIRRVSFEGNPQLSPKLLHAQMRAITPWKPFSSLREKDAYTPDAFEQDRRRILDYYQNHGYPEARIGRAQVSRIEERSRHWLPWPHPVTRSGLSLSIPLQAGPFYQFESIRLSPDLRQAANQNITRPLPDMFAENAKAFSAEDLDKLCRWWTARIQPKDPKLDFAPYRAVEANPSFDAEKHTVRVTLDLSDSAPYTVQRIEFRGLHRFSDRYMRRRILLREGHPVNERELEAGLARLARTGYFRQIHKEDIQVHLDEATHTAAVSIKVQEIGRQRASLVGGQGQFGSTLGIAYTVFDLLNCEELISANLEGGPESLQIMLGIAKEGIFGTRASLAFSIFNNVVRPRFAKSAQGPFFTTHTTGIQIPWTYPLSNTDSVGVNFTLSRTTTDLPLGTPPGLTGLPPLDLRTRVSSRAFGVGWLHDAGNERILFSNSASGGFLGGSENMVRSSGEYGRIVRDPLFAPSNAWAFRTTFTGAGSYHGDMPFYSRSFSGDDVVRGLRNGELGPDALATGTAPSGAPWSSAAPAGANLVSAANAEYRVRLGGGTEAAGFFDLGSGWLLPNWLGPTKPLLLGSTNGVLHGSTGIEFRWTVPGVQVPIRAYYAFNVLRLDRAIRLSDKSIFFAHNRFSAFGWGLGSLF